MANQILGCLLIILSFRVGKSVFLEFAQHVHVKLVFTGLASMMAIGPLFYLFAKSCCLPSFVITKKHCTHFIPCILGFLVGIWMSETHLTTLPKVFFIILFLSYYLHLIIYLLVSYKYILAQKKVGISNDIYSLLRLLFFALLAIWVVYVLNLIDDIVPYVLGPILYSIIAYTVSFVIIQKNYLQKAGHVKYSTTSISEEKSQLLLKKLYKIIQEDQQYKNPSITLKSLSETLHISTQALSMIINQNMKTNFNGFINKYRIDEAKKLLKSEAYQHKKIASIAFEVGFNSISSFNSAFKTLTKTTPAKFRSQQD